MIDEESFKKRIQMHEEFIKEQERKHKEREDNYIKDIEEIKSKSELDLKSLIKVKEELKDKNQILERNVADLRKVKEGLQEEIQRVRK